MPFAAEVNYAAAGPENNLKQNEEGDDDIAFFVPENRLSNSVTGMGGVQ